MTKKIHSEISHLREENKELRQELFERAEEHEKIWNELAFVEKFIWEAISRLNHSERVEVLALMKMAEKDLKKS